ncbi:MAG: RNA 3'-terminal phosphate cyclase [Candidatus Bathyarchaeia archaeon]
MREFLSLIEIPGDMLEGGGQIIRTALALATLLKKDIRLFNIRGGRKPPGLKAQHATGIKAAAAVSNAEVEGLEVGSRELYFKPKTIKGGIFRFEVGTAGSVSLVLQAIMPALAFSSTRTEISITGGTDVKWSPTIDYLRLVALPVLSNMGYKAQLTVKRRGHYPKGGGEVVMTVDPVEKLRGVQLLRRGEVLKVGGVSHCVNLPAHVADRQASSAEKYLERAGIRSVEVIREVLSGLGPGSGVTLYAASSGGCIIGADALGEKGKPAERVGEEAAAKLVEEIQSQTCLDRHMGDMIIPYMAVAEGRSHVTTSKITLHTLTNIRVSEIITGVKFEVKGGLNQPGSISVEGLGLTA